MVALEISEDKSVDWEESVAGILAVVAPQK